MRFSNWLSGIRSLLSSRSGNKRKTRRCVSKTPHWTPVIERLESRMVLAIPTSANPLVFAADVNGDHLTDTISVLYDLSRGIVVDTTLANSNGKPLESVLGDGSGVFQYPPQVGDVNGDDKADLIFMFSDTQGLTHIRTAIGQTNGHFAQTVETILSDGRGVFQNPVLVGDVDGDGRSDLVFRFSGIDGIHIRTSFGQASGKFSNTVQTIVPIGNAIYQKQDVIRDVNGDGREDLLIPLNKPNLGPRTLIGLGQVNGNFSSTVEALSYGDLGGGKAVALMQGGVFEVYDGKNWTVNNTRTSSIVDLGGGKAGVLLTDGTLQIYDGTTSITVVTGVHVLIPVRSNGAFSLVDGSGKAFLLNASGIQSAYSGSQQITQIIPAGSGVVTQFSGGGVYFSLDGKNLASVPAYSGSQHVAQMVSAGSGVVTLFDGGGVYYSADGQNLAAIPAYTGSQHVVQMVSAGGGVETLFDGGGVYFSADGKSLGSGSAYTGAQKVAWMRSAGGGVVTGFGDGSVYFSPDGKNLGGGGNTQPITDYYFAKDGSLWYLGTNSLDSFGDRQLIRISNQQVTHVFVTTAAIAQRWFLMSVGGSDGILGFPTGDVQRNNQIQWQNFQNGTKIVFSTTDGAQTIRTVSNGADFAKLFEGENIDRNIGIDVIELASGQYSLARTDIWGIDRAGHPLTIRPAPNATVVWSGDAASGSPGTDWGSGTVGAFDFRGIELTEKGPFVPTSNFTLDGHNPNDDPNGSNSSWLFTNYNIGSTGIITTGGSNNLTFLNLSFAGNAGHRELSRDPNLDSNTNPINFIDSHTFYIYNVNSHVDPKTMLPKMLDGRCHDITIMFCNIDGGNRSLSAMQFFHEDGPYNVYFVGNKVSNCTWGVILATHHTSNDLKKDYKDNIQIVGNTFTDCDVSLSVEYDIQGTAIGNTAYNAPYVNLLHSTNWTDDFTNRWNATPSRTANVLGSYQIAANNVDYTLVAESDGSLFKLDSHGIQVGSQQFSGSVTDVVYSSAENVTVVSLSDGRMLKVKGIGGTGANMFAVNESATGFVSQSGNSYLLGSQKFNVGVAGVYLVSYQTGNNLFVALDNGLLVKIKNTGGTGDNMLALQEVSGGITGLSGYSYWQGTQKFSGVVNGVVSFSPSNTHDAAVIQDVTVIGVSDGRMLKVQGSGGTGQNMFGVTEVAAGFAASSKTSYWIGSQKFSVGITALFQQTYPELLNGSYQSISELFIALNNGTLVKVRASGGTGNNMLAIQETGGTITGLSGFKYWEGSQVFGSPEIITMSYSPANDITVIELSDGRILKIRSAGGTGQNMFAIQENSAVPDYYKSPYTDGTVSFSAFAPDGFQTFKGTIQSATSPSKLVLNLPKGATPQVGDFLYIDFSSTQYRIQSLQTGNQFLLNTAVFGGLIVKNEDAKATFTGQILSVGSSTLVFNTDPKKITGTPQVGDYVHIGTSDVKFRIISISNGNTLSLDQPISAIFKTANVTIFSTPSSLTFSGLILSATSTATSSTLVLNATRATIDETPKAGDYVYIESSTTRYKIISVSNGKLLLDKPISVAIPSTGAKAKFIRGPYLDCGVISTHFMNLA